MSRTPAVSRLGVICKSGLIVQVKAFSARDHIIRNHTAGARRTPTARVQAFRTAHRTPGDIRATPHEPPVLPAPVQLRSPHPPAGTRAVGEWRPAFFLFVDLRPHRRLGTRQEMRAPLDEWEYRPRPPKWRRDTGVCVTKIAVLGLGRMGHAISDDLTLVERRAERLLQPLRRAPGPRCASGCAFRGGHLPGGWLPETLEGIRPVLSTLSDHVKHYGRPEIASSAKLAVNLILLPGVATLAEAVTVGRAGGLGGGEPNDLLADSPMMGPGIRHPEPLPDRPGRLGTDLVDDRARGQGRPPGHRAGRVRGPDAPPPRPAHPGSVPGGCPCGPQRGRHRLRLPAVSLTPCTSGRHQDAPREVAQVTRPPTSPVISTGPPIMFIMLSHMEIPGPAPIGPSRRDSPGKAYGVARRPSPWRTATRCRACDRRLGHRLVRIRGILASPGHAPSRGCQRHDPRTPAGWRAAIPEGYERWLDLCSGFH